MRVIGRNNTVDTGKLRDLVDYQTAVQTSDGEGGFTKSWTTKKQVYAKIIPMRDTRVLEAAQVTFNAGYVFRVRYDSEIVCPGRFVFEGNLYTIHAVENIDSLDRYMNVTCYTHE